MTSSCISSRVALLLLMLSGLLFSELGMASDETTAKDYQKIYQRSCFACHSTGAAGAPRTGDTAAWDARMEEKGMDGLVAASLSGSGGMPPKGLCGDCDATDMRALIELMRK